MQYINRRKIHQLVWTIAILLYGFASLMEFLMNPEIIDITFIPFSIFYVSSSLLVGLLGSGQLFLIIKKKISYIFLGFISALSIALVVALILTPFPQTISFSDDLGENIRLVSTNYPYSVRIYAIILSSVGGTALLLGSLYSFIRDRHRYYSLFFSLGALMPMFRNIPFGYLGNELGGVIFLFIGFLLSNVYIKKQTSKFNNQISQK
ncbi:MAG: hypothetical protein ACFFD1_01110 [Candidatus Thorarchaeota archaeon]